MRLLNDPGWLAFIGDRNVRTVDDAVAYIESGPQTSYREHGFDLLLVETRADCTAVGICGLLQRDFLPHPDIGFAILQEHTGRGYTTEAGRAVLTDAADRLQLRRILAITRPDNAASQRVLARLGFVYEDTRQLQAHEAPSAVYTATIPGA